MDLNNMNEVSFLNHIRNPNYNKYDYYLIFDKIILDKNYVFFEILLKHTLSNVYFIELNEELLFYLNVIGLCILRNKNLFNISNMIKRMNNSGICLTNEHFDFLFLLNYENNSIFDSDIFTNDINESIQNATKYLKKNIIYEIVSKKKYYINPFLKSTTYQRLKLDIFKNVKFYIFKSLNFEREIYFKNISNTIKNYEFENETMNTNKYIDILEFSFKNITIFTSLIFILTHGYKVNIFYFENLKKCLKYSKRINSLMFCDTIKNNDELVSRVFNNLHLKIEIISFL